MQPVTSLFELLRDEVAVPAEPDVKLLELALSPTRTSLNLPAALPWNSLPAPSTESAHAWIFARWSAIHLSRVLILAAAVVKLFSLVLSLARTLPHSNGPRTRSAFRLKLPKALYVAPAVGSSQNGQLQVTPRSVLYSVAPDLVG